MLYRAYLTVPVSEFQHFVVRNKESWEKGDITDPLVQMKYAEYKFRSLQEDKLWVTNDPMKANMLDLTTVIGNFTRVFPAPYGTIYLVDINETHYWGSFYGTCIGVKNTLLNKFKHTNTCRIKWCMY